MRRRPSWTDAPSKPSDDGGPGWGTGWTSATLLPILLALIAWQSVGIPKAPRGPTAAPFGRRTNAQNA